MSVTSHVAVVPRDGFFCKDGRGWHTSSSGRGHALDWPWPSTILGALRTASGREKETLGGRALSAEEWQGHARTVSLYRLLALRRPVGNPWHTHHRVWPVPMDALWVEEQQAGKKVVFLDPRPGPDGIETLGRKVGAEEEQKAREKLWWPAVEDSPKPLAPPRWWSETQFVAWLTDPTATANPGIPEWARASALRRVQARVGIDSGTFAASESFLFSHDVVETLDRSDGVPAAEWAIGAEVKLENPFAAPMARIGSDSRLAFIEGLSEGLFAPPASLREAFDRGSQGLRLIVVTPAKFQKGWLPSGFTVQGGEFRGQLRGIPSSDVVLRAAFVPRPIHVSGWNMTGGGSSGGAPDEERKRGGPKETSRLVPPGAVYFFERVSGEPITAADAEKLWLAALGARTDEGFGLVVPAIWTPRR